MSALLICPAGPTPIPGGSLPTGPTLLSMRPRGRRLLNPLGAVYLAVFAIAGAIGALAGTTWIRADSVAVAGTLVWAGALIVAVLVASPPPRMFTLSMAWLISPILMFLAAGGLWSTVLDQRGERVVATVVGVRDGSEKGRHLYYALADQHDRRIPGELGTWPGSRIGASNNPEGAVGQRVTVVRVPRAWSTRACPRNWRPARAP